MKIDRDKREIELKVVYYGPGLAGKTTNLQHIYERVHPERTAHERRKPCRRLVVVSPRIVHGGATNVGHASRVAAGL